MRRHTYRPLLVLPFVVATAYLAAAYLLPTLNTHCGSYREKCASNMRQVGLAAIMYANWHEHQMPDDLHLILREQGLEASVLICPLSTLPSLASATTREADAAISDNRISYIYIGKGLKVDASAETVLMYEPIGDHGDGINVLFADAHVEWLDLAEAKKLIARINSGQNSVRYPDPASATQP